MANITIRNLDDDIRTRLRVQAARRGRSVEEEVRQILRKAVGRAPRSRDLASSIRSISGRRTAWTWSCRRANRGVSRRPSSDFAAMSMLLDTNAVSELIRKAPAPPVAGWVSDHPVKDLFFSAVSEAELRYGAAIPPAGRRRDTLLFTIHTMLRDAFHDRVLPFDRHAARAYGHIAAVRRAAGRPVAPADCQIAANRGVSQHGGGNAQHSRFRGNGNRSGGSLGAGMSATTGQTAFMTPRDRSFGSSSCPTRGKCGS